LVRRFTVGEKNVNEQVKDRKVSEGFSGECLGQAVDTFVASLETTFSGHGWPLVVRVDKETLDKLDLLVAGGVCKSRVEAAQYLLNQGLQSGEDTLARIQEVKGQIDEIQHDLADWAQTSKA
jgi:hypothetical protein